MQSGVRVEGPSGKEKQRVHRRVGLGRHPAKGVVHQVVDHALVPFSSAWLCASVEPFPSNHPGCTSRCPAPSSGDRSTSTVPNPPSRRPRPRPPESAAEAESRGRQPPVRPAARCSASADRRRFPTAGSCRRLRPRTSASTGIPPVPHATLRTLCLTSCIPLAIPAFEPAAGIGWCSKPPPETSYVPVSISTGHDSVVPAARVATTRPYYTPSVDA